MMYVFFARVIVVVLVRGGIIDRRFFLKVYNGFFIPKGSWVIANLWCVAYTPLASLRSHDDAHNAHIYLLKGHPARPPTLPGP